MTPKPSKLEPSALAPSGLGDAQAPYTIQDHKHRFAAWAASRAASTKGCRFKVITGIEILERGSFTPRFESLGVLPEPSDIDNVHKEWRLALIDAAKDRRVAFTHGVAAKLINVYLKALFVCGGNHEDPRVKALHPPIDALLLRELAAKNIGGSAREWRRFGTMRWSKLDSSEYQAVIDCIRHAIPGRPLWEIESHWRGHQ